MARGDLTDGEWELVEPFLPMAATGPIPDLRRQFDAVMWRFRVGSPWRDIPEQYGNWSTIYGQFHSWARKGVFQALMEGMIAEAAARAQLHVAAYVPDDATDLVAGHVPCPRSHVGH